VTAAESEKESCAIIGRNMYIGGGSASGGGERDMRSDVRLHIVLLYKILGTG
jgi:hypothetical protein